MSQNGRVSNRRYESPTPPPEAVAQAMGAFGNSNMRAEILRALSEKPEGSTIMVVAERIAADYRSVWRHLRELRDAGLVRAEVPEGMSGQLHIVFRMNEDAVVAANQAMLAYMLGRDSH